MPSIHTGEPYRQAATRPEPPPDTPPGMVRVRYDKRVPGVYNLTVAVTMVIALGAWIDFMRARLDGHWGIGIAVGVVLFGVAMGALVTTGSLAYETTRLVPKEKGDDR
jgi:hypothetical protein